MIRSNTDRVLACSADFCDRWAKYAWMNCGLSLNFFSPHSNTFTHTSFFFLLFSSLALVLRRVKSRDTE